MKQRSAVLDSLLLTIRQHDGFKELLDYVEPPVIRPFVKSKAEQPERARSEWIYESGQSAQHGAWLAFLTGANQEN